MSTAVDASKPPCFITVEKAIAAFNQYGDDAIRLNLSRVDKTYGSNIRYIQVEIHLENEVWIPLNVIFDFRAIACAIYPGAKFAGARIPFVDPKFTELAQWIDSATCKLVEHSQCKFISRKVREEGVKLRWFQTMTKDDVTLEQAIIRLTIPFRKAGESIDPSAISRAQLIENSVPKSFTYGEVASLFKANCSIRAIIDLSTIVVCAHGAMHHCEAKFLTITAQPEANSAKPSDSIRRIESAIDESILSALTK